jgi:hypothetical protein
MCALYQSAESIGSSLGERSSAQWLRPDTFCSTWKQNALRHGHSSMSGSKSDEMDPHRSHRWGIWHGRERAWSYMSIKEGLLFPQGLVQQRRQADTGFC